MALFLKFKNYFIIFGAVLLATFALFHPGLPPTHDGEYHVIRFYEFYKVLSDGVLYPRWAPDLNNGYGIPLFNYVYPLPNYAAALLHFFGLGFIDSFKMSMVIASLLGAIFFYLWIKEIWGSISGVVASIFYIFSPYRLVDVYVRGSVGELWALAFFPGFLWVVTNALKKQDVRWSVLSACFLAATILSHNILAVIFVSFALVYIAYLFLTNANKKSMLVHIAIIYILGIGLSAIFWLPALVETKYVDGLQVFEIGNNFPELYQLIIPSWGTGFSAGALENQMSFQIGIANLLAIFISLFAILKRKNKNKKLITFFLILFFITMLFMLKISSQIWEIMPLIRYFQFPWRLLSVEIIIASFLAGSVVAIYKNRIFLILFIILPILLGISYAKPAYYMLRPDSYYTTRSNFIDGTNSPGNAFNIKTFNRQLQKKDTKVQASGGGMIIKQSMQQTRYQFIVTGKNISNIVINTAFFPGWKAFIGSSRLDIARTRDGLMSIQSPQGEHIITMKFDNTLVQTIAAFISIFSALLLLLVYNLRKSLLFNQ